MQDNSVAIKIIVTVVDINFSSHRLHYTSIIPPGTYIVTVALYTKVQQMRGKKNYQGSSILAREAVFIWSFLLAVNLTTSSRILEMTMSRGSMAPLWIHLGMVVLACVNPRVSSSQLICGLNCPLTVVRRRRWGSSSQRTHTNWRDGGPVNFWGSPGVVVSSGLAKGDPVSVCVSVCQFISMKDKMVTC